MKEVPIDPVPEQQLSLPLELLNGTAIGPLLFISYINELADVLRMYIVTVTFFVDDLKVYVTMIPIRDVKTAYFSEPVCRNRFFTGYRKAYCERDNCHRLLRACYQSITCCFTAAVAHIPDARTPSQRNKGEWRIKAVGGRGNRCYAAVS